MRRLVLLRHGRTEWNETGRAQGHADVPLDEVGLAQAKEVAPVLAALRPVALWSSDLARAAQTADAVALRVVVPAFLGWEADPGESFGVLANCGWIELEHSASTWTGGVERWRLTAWNRVVT